MIWKFDKIISCPTPSIWFMWNLIWFSGRFHMETRLCPFQKTFSKGKKQLCRCKFSEIENLLETFYRYNDKNMVFYLHWNIVLRKMFGHVLFNSLALLKYCTSNNNKKKKNDVVKTWLSNSNLCFEKHWFSIIFGDEKLSVFNFYLKTIKIALKL